MAPGRRGGGGGGRGGGGRGRGFSGRSAPRSRDADLDDVDRFHAGKSKLSLRLEDDAAEEDAEEDLSGDEAGVFDLGGSSEDEEGEEDEEEADSEEEAAAGGSLGRMAKAERALRSRMALQRGEDDGEEEEEEAPRGAKGWGKRKQAYYDDGEARAARGSPHGRRKR